MDSEAEREQLALMAEQARLLRNRLPHLMRLVEQTIEEGGDTHDLRQEIAMTKKTLAGLNEQLPDGMRNLEDSLEEEL